LHNPCKYFALFRALCNRRKLPKLPGKFHGPQYGTRAYREPDPPAAVCEDCQAPSNKMTRAPLGTSSKESQRAECDKLKRCLDSKSAASVRALQEAKTPEIYGT
jgi:hypothetical protein